MVAGAGREVEADRVVVSVETEVRRDDRVSEGRGEAIVDMLDRSVMTLLKCREVEQMANVYCCLFVCLLASTVLWGCSS